MDTSNTPLLPDFDADWRAGMPDDLFFSVETCMRLAPLMERWRDSAEAAAQADANHK